MVETVVKSIISSKSAPLRTRRKPSKSATSHGRTGGIAGASSSARQVSERRFAAGERGRDDTAIPRRPAVIELSVAAERIVRVTEQQELIESVSAAVCERYVADIKLPEGTGAILLRVYFDGDAAYQLAPPAHAGRWPWQLLEEEVAEPPVDDIPGIEEVLELAAEDDAVLQTYFEALTRRLEAALGIRALHEDLD